MATAAWRRRFDDVIAAGIEVWKCPSVVHAKIIVADDRVPVGTLNLDAWALYRDHEVALLAESDEIAEVFRTQIVDVDIATSQPGRGPSGVGHVVRWFADKIVYFL